MTFYVLHIYLSSYIELYLKLLLSEKSCFSRVSRFFNILKMVFLLTTMVINKIGFGYAGKKYREGGISFIHAFIDICSFFTLHLHLK